jgi:hypothetical protein
MSDIRQALKDFVATSNSGKYTDEATLLSKFPELKGYDIKKLKDFVAISNSGKYKNEEELFSKFPDFNQVTPEKKKFYLFKKKKNQRLLLRHLHRKMVYWVRSLLRRKNLHLTKQENLFFKKIIR